MERAFPFDAQDALALEKAVFVADPASGLRAIIALDDLTLGPAAGGVRTRAYPSVEAALTEVAGLARAMTAKCALAGLSAGGGKAVVLDHPELDRPRAFEALGRAIQDLRGAFRTAGDLGTTGDDLAAMARATDYVHTGEPALAAAVGRGLLRCVEACVHARGDGAGTSVAGLRVAVQGAGAIGAAVARALSKAGAEIILADVDDERARTVAGELGARVVAASEILAADADVLCPCAVGGVIDESTAATLSAFAVVPGANNALASDAAGAALFRRGVLFVPDVIASAGAVVDGIGKTVMGLADRSALIDALGDTALEVLSRAEAERRPPTEVARALARERIAEKRTR